MAWTIAALSAPAYAQQDEEFDNVWGAGVSEEDKAEGGGWGEQQPAEDGGWGEQAPQQAEGDGEEPAGKDQDDDESGPGDAGPREWFFGPFLRLNVVPLDVLMGFVFDEAPSIVHPGFGLAATYRQKDGPSFQVGLGYQSYSATGPVRSSGDPEQDTEFIESDLALIHVTGSMLWSSEFSKLLALEYGFGLDIGIVTGKLVRTEAYRTPFNPEYQPCLGELNPDWTVDGTPATPRYCDVGSSTFDQEGEHYGVEEERIPPIVPLPMLPHLALRITPMDALAIKVEAAFGLVQFWAGLSVAYAPAL